ncbi:hypothetical protein TNCT_512891 [Trichonephila clavata]|uniref:Uncharacterized protein n=1 Tax=Trichonephila clavata TaxID=2740835 RepID=A0A8X6L5L7_TRICU|nr:hypothetical protein TNCT_512891 [Trichonephila clavata]
MRSSNIHSKENQLHAHKGKPSDALGSSKERLINLLVRVIMNWSNMPNPFHLKGGIQAILDINSKQGVALTTFSHHDQKHKRNSKYI